MYAQANWWALLFLILGLIDGLLEFFKFFTVEYMGYKIITALRSRVFVEAVHREVAFYDQKRHAASEC